MKVILVLFVLVASCGESSSEGLDIEGKPGEEAARMVATSVCERDARCGRPIVECTQGGGDQGGGARCTGRIRPLDEMACFEDVFKDMSRLLSCRAISSPEATLIRSCFEPLIARSCVTQVDVDERARQAERTGERPADEARPPACEQMFRELGGRCPR